VHAVRRQYRAAQRALGRQQVGGDKRPHRQPSTRRARGRRVAARRRRLTEPHRRPATGTSSELDNQTNNNHGRICVFVRSHFLVRHVPLPNYDTFDVPLLAVHHAALNTTISTLY